MAQIDFNDVFDGLTLALHSFFAGAKIHSGNIEQNLNLGDFNVLPITTSHNSQMGSRAKESVLFDVIYYPKSGGREECLRISRALINLLGSITTPNGNIIHCLSFEADIKDDVLHTIVGYPFFVHTIEDKEKMETFEIKQEG